MKVTNDGSQGIARFFSHHPAGQAGDPGKQLNNPMNMDALPGAYPAGTIYGDSQVQVPITGTQLSQRPQQRAFAVGANRRGDPALQLPPGYDRELAAMPMPTELAMGAGFQKYQGDSQAGISRGLSTALGATQRRMGKRA